MSNADKVLMEMKGYDKDNIPRFVYESLRTKYFAYKGFNYEQICKKSKAAAELFLWIRGLFTYGKIMRQRGGQIISPSNLNQSQSPARQQHARSSSEFGYTETPLRQPRPQPSHLNSTASRNAKT